MFHDQSLIIKVISITWTYYVKFDMVDVVATVLSIKVCSLQCTFTTNAKL